MNKALYILLAFALFVSSLVMLAQEAAGEDSPEWKSTKAQYQLKHIYGGVKEAMDESV